MPAWMFEAKAHIRYQNAVDFGRHDEIALGQAVDLVRVNRHFRFAPGQQNVGVVALLLRDCAGTVHKGERFLKIGEFKRLVQMMLSDYLPIGQLIFERVQRSAFERENAAAAGNARLVGKRHRRFTSSERYLPS